ncbi:MAG: RDD family protein [Cryomorphaceae bacterium]|nr:RDD family protein [Flavobacteriales bacterium]
MRKVSIRTAQNVAIDFPLASIGQRMLGLAVDLMVMGVGVFILFLLLVSLNPNFVYLVFIVFLFYTPVSEMLMDGQTLGKKMALTRVVNINGKAPGYFETLIRWAFRMVDIWFSLGAIGVIFISTGARAQRLGGILSNTMVVSLKGEMELSLNDILRIDDRSKYEPVYPDVYRFKEDEMLTVKNVVDRYRKFRNVAHATLVEKTAQKCADVLGMNTPPDDKMTFLKTLIKDYIVVTRS